MLNPDKKYNLEYYLGVVDKVVSMGAHILGPFSRPLYKRRTMLTGFIQASKTWQVSLSQGQPLF